MDRSDEGSPDWVVNGWTIEEDVSTVEDECRIYTYWAVRGDERREIDVSPYAPLTNDMAEMMAATGWPTRENFGSIFPVSIDQVSALYWQQRALKAEKALSELAA